MILARLFLFAGIYLKVELSKLDELNEVDVFRYLKRQRAGTNRPF